MTTTRPSTSAPATTIPFRRPCWRTWPSEKTVVWFKYNWWKIAWDAQYGFVEKFGFNLVQLRGLNAEPTSQNPAPGFFDTVTYRGMPFVKYYAYDAARNEVNAGPDIGVVSIVDPAKASALVNITNPTTAESVPYVLRSGKFWYVADLPFSYIGPRDRYLVLADLLHDVLGAEPERVLGGWSGRLSGLVAP